MCETLPQDDEVKFTYNVKWFFILCILVMGIMLPVPFPCFMQSDPGRAPLHV